MLGLFFSAFATFFVVIDPIACVPVFAALTKRARPDEQRRMAFHSVAVASAIMLAFALGGELLLTALGISLDSFGIAGGIMLFLIALRMVFEQPEPAAEEALDPDAPARDVAVFPMAIPMIAGPGAIAATMVLMARTDGVLRSFVVLVAMAVVFAILLAGLLFAQPAMRALGNRAHAVITRVLGVLLASLATQFVVDGIRASFG